MKGESVSLIRCRRMGHVSNSDLARKRSRRGQVAPMTCTSFQLWWFDARMNPPERGTFSRPSAVRSFCFSNIARSTVPRAE
jgi:hypothetical protein